MDQHKTSTFGGKAKFLLAIVLTVTVVGCSVFSSRSTEKKNHPEVSLDTFGTEDTVLKNLEALEQELNKIERRGK